MNTPLNRYNVASAKKAAARRRRAKSLLKQGLTLEQIGRRMGRISKQRVWNMLNWDKIKAARAA